MPGKERRIQAGPSAPEAGVRERILDAACKLFYKEGIQAVGIQRLIDEADIAKASLYAHFASKDDLVAAYLERRGAAWRAQVEDRLASSRLTPRAKLLRVFDLLVEWAEDPEFRGCPFIKASSEVIEPTHPAKAVIGSHRAWLHRFLADLARDAGATSPDRVSTALLVLMDGAMSTALLDGDRGAARHARWAAERLLDR